MDNELMAVVDEQGDVLTILLMSNAGTYLRYSGAWIPVTDPAQISGWNAVPVKDEALDVYDPIDQAGYVTHINSLPLQDNSDFNEFGQGGVLVAAAMPPITSFDDVPAAIEAAAANPEFRWYVAKRIKALGLEVELPWESETDSVEGVGVEPTKLSGPAVCLFSPSPCHRHPGRPGIHPLFHW